MLYTESTDKLHGLCKTIGWDTVIEDAESGIRKSQRRIARLRNSIRLAKKKLKAGEPYEE